jgi:hypothetical protein
MYVCTSIYAAVNGFDNDRSATLDDKSPNLTKSHCRTVLMMATAIGGRCAQQYVISIEPSLCTHISTSCGSVFTLNCKRSGAVAEQLEGRTFVSY